MKNKQVKQMIESVTGCEWNGCYLCHKHEFYGFIAHSVSYFSVVSITAMDYWLFLRNHKIEKESWQVTIK